MFIVPLLFIILVVWFFFSIARNPNSNNINNPSFMNYNHNQNIKPIEILKERYARGEISEEEYIKIKRNLES